MKNNQSLIITRGQIGLFASFVAGAGVLIGLLSLLWANEINQWVTLAFGIAVAGIIAWAIATPQEFFATITGRQSQYGTRAILSTLLMIGIVGLTYNLLERAVITMDMTVNTSFTLSDETIEILEQIQTPIQITGFYPPEMLTDREIDDQFFRLYESESNGMITRQYIDPIQQPALATAFGAASSINFRDGDVYVSFLNDVGEVDFDSIALVPRTTSQERDMTQAILRLLSAGQFTIYFDQSLGEIDTLDNTQTGMSLINTYMQETGFVTAPIDLISTVASGQLIPQNASALILANPRVDPPESVIAVIDEYLRRGGSLFIMADTQTDFMLNDSFFNNYMWTNWGIRMTDMVVIDPLASGATPLDIRTYAISDGSSISSLLDPTDPNSVTEFRVTRAVEVSDNPPVFNGRVIQTSEVSYGETNLDTLFTQNEYPYNDGDDVRGPLTTVAFADDPVDEGGSGARIILVGDSDFVTNGQISSPLGNVYLFLGSIGWLTDFNETVSFTPQPRIIAPLIAVSPKDLDTIAYITILLIPGLTLMTGLGIWFWRMRR